MTTVDQSVEKSEARYITENSVITIVSEPVITTDGTLLNKQTVNEEFRTVLAFNEQVQLSIFKYELPVCSGVYGDCGATQWSPVCNCNIRVCTYYLPWHSGYCQERRGGNPQ